MKLRNLSSSFFYSLALLVVSTQSYAEVFDFQDLIDTSNGSITGTLADGSLFGLANPGELAFQTFDWTKGGLTLTGSAAGSHFAYLDSGGAGLGVCAVANASNQCNPSSDDNVTTGEVLQVAFNQLASVDFSQTIFRDADHNIFDPNIEVSLDSGTWASLNLASILTANLFEFRTLDNVNQFYINAVTATAAVPGPSALVLLGLGLAGLFGTRRRRLAAV